jgi:hypothetical protein
MLNDFSIENTKFHNGTQLYALQLIIKYWLHSGNLTLDIDYKLDDYIYEQVYALYVQLVFRIPYCEMDKSTLVYDT